MGHRVDGITVADCVRLKQIDKRTREILKKKNRDQYHFIQYCSVLIKVSNKLFFTSSITKPTRHDTDNDDNL